MKKVFVIAFALLMSATVFAEANLPFNHNATLIPANASLVSGGFNVGLSQFMIEYTQGLTGTNIRGKLAAQTNGFIVEALFSHRLFDWNKIDMGFSYGGQFNFRRRDIYELSPIIMWNMSHKFNKEIDFYGGSRFKLNFGMDYRWNPSTSSWGYNTPILDPDWHLYLGTQIDIAKNLELYIELQPGLLSAGSSAYAGINYYISKGIQAEK